MKNFLIFIVVLIKFTFGEVEIDQRILEAKSFNEFYGEKPIEVEKRIAGGNPVARGDIPYFANIYVVNRNTGITYLVGGSLIQYNWVLTSAAPVSTLFNETYVLLGIVQLGVQNSEYATGFFASSISTHFPHPQFSVSSPNFENNIGLLKIPLTQANFNSLIYVKTISLPRWEDASNSLVGFFGKASGFGFDGFGNNTETLKEISNLEVMTNADCAATDLSAYINENVFCTKNSGAKSVCAGDEGGPFVGTLGGETRQVGVISFSVPGCSTGIPATYTRITNYLQWIEDIVGDGIIPGNSSASIKLSISLSIITFFFLLSK